MSLISGLEALTDRMLDAFSKRQVLFPIIGFFIFISLSTLSFSPLPWFDEVFFADLSHSYLYKGGFYLKFSPIFNKTEFLFYGPVYFWLQAAWAKLIGFQVFGFRLVNFVSGLIFLILFRQFLTGLGIPKLMTTLVAVLLLSDPIIQSNLHSGRMDFLSIMLSMAGLMVFLAYTKKSQLALIPVSSIFFALGFLTTPRILFFLVPVFLYLLVRFRKDHLIGLFLLLVCSSIPVFLWIFSRFGNPLAYIDAFLSNLAVASHIGPIRNSFSFFRYPQYILWYGLVIVSTILQFRFWFLKKRFNLDAAFFLLVIVFFHFLVVEKGPYSAMVVPMYAGLALVTWLDIREISIWKAFYQGIFFLNFLIFSGIFSLKMGIALANKSKTSEQKFLKILPSDLLRRKKVVASFEYFYILNSLDCRYYGFQLGPIPQRIQFHFQTVDFDYLLLSKEEANCHQFIEYQRGGKIEKVCEVNMPDDNASSFVQFASSKLHITRPDYSGVLYKHIH